jgi:hypothetical protein
MNYSLVRSKTFWTILVMVVVGAGNAVVPIIPADYQAVVVMLLGALASTFHLNTAQNAGAVN